MSCLPGICDSAITELNTKLSKFCKIERIQRKNAVIQQVKLFSDIQIEIMWLR